MKKALAALSLALVAGIASAAPTLDGLNTDAGYNRGANQQVVGGFGTDLQLYNVSYDNDATNLYIHIGGAFRTGGGTTGFWFFLDSAAGGTETLDTTGATSGAIQGQGGVVMETGFTPDFMFLAENGDGGNRQNYRVAFYNFGTDTETAIGTFDATAGSFTASGTPLSGFAADCDNSAALDGTATASAVTTGYEFQIPLAAIGSPAVPGTIKAMIAAGDGGNGYYSNQTLAGAGAGAGNIGGGNGNSPKADFQANTIGQFGGGSYSGVQTMTWNLTNPANVADWSMY